MTDTRELSALIREVPDYPKPGIRFYDITTLLASPSGFAQATAALAAPFGQVDKVVGIEARGFILAAPLAHQLSAGFVPVRKPGKLPYETVATTYELEYGVDSLEMHVDAVGPDDTVLIVDDVLATGGTAAATLRLVESTGATIVGMSFLIELGALGGRGRVTDAVVDTFGDADIPLHSVIVYE